MKILILCQLFPPLIYGGGEVLLWDLAKSLASRGHEVHVVTQKAIGVEDFESRDGVSIYRVGAPLHYAGALTTSFPESLAYMIGAFFTGVNLMIRKRIDIIHSNTYVPAIVGQLCATILRRTHVMTVHDVYLAGMPWFWKKWSQQSGVGYFARLLGPILERLLLRMPVTVIHTVSETSRRDLLQIGTHSRIMVVPNGIDIGNYAGHSVVQTNPRQALFIGRLVFYKNLEVVFNALAKVIQRLPDAKLIIVGDGPMRATWERMAHQMNLQEHVSFLGRVSHQDKLRLLVQSAFLLLPSMVEGFGIVILEAFACEKPVLVSKIEALQELVSDGIDGYLADPTSEEEWAKRMLLLFTEQQRTQEMGMRGQEKLIGHFAIDRVAGMMVRLYDSILSKE